MDFLSISRFYPLMWCMLWAFGMATSRSFIVDGVPRLVPFVDMLNHRPAAGGIDVITPPPTLLRLNPRRVVLSDAYPNSIGAPFWLSCRRSVATNQPYYGWWELPYYAAEKQGR